jgi:hypothetical protein
MVARYNATDILENAAGVYVQGPRDPQKLDNIKPPLSALIFRNVRLGLAETFGELLLCEAGFFAGGDDVLQKLVVFRGMERLQKTLSPKISFL